MLLVVLRRFCNTHVNIFWLKTRLKRDSLRVKMQRINARTASTVKHFLRLDAVEIIAFRRVPIEIQKIQKWNINSSQIRTEPPSISCCDGLSLLWRMNWIFTSSDESQIWTSEPSIRCRAYTPLSHSSSKYLLVQNKMYLNLHFIT